MSLLRTSLSGRPLELIKGIGSDYDAAWEHLDSIYGDPRLVADTVTHDISKFKPLREDEDSRFCDLTQLEDLVAPFGKQWKRGYIRKSNHMDDNRNENKNESYSASEKYAIQASGWKFQC
ncbi:Uncharacterized protein K02A2.6 [Paramuricea clavata]|uniref:Uncharacterized protein K02A2.6 n=1 Tax=Paramuricea clavata TaxID=317549 RepID=A0A7D9IF62_PARCT|nr:Uncharacterized protein K02A2.6 [Paramuricea clavata]